MDNISELSQVRFWERVSKDGPIPDPENYPDIKSRCWEWTRGIQSNGYGAYIVHMGSGRKSVLTHRLSWIFTSGAIPDGACVLHKCDNRTCVNPSHLFLGSIAENNKDMRDKGGGHNPPYKKGTEIGLAKMNEWIVRIIRRLNESGMTYADCGRLFGVSNVAARLAIVGKTWRHIS